MTDLSMDDFTIDIVAYQDDEARIGDTLNFDVNYWIDPDLTPVGATPTTVIEWINHNGDVLGDQTSLTYTPAEPGWYSIQVKVTSEDLAFDYSVVITEGYTFSLLPLVDVDFKFQLPYENDHNLLTYSNMDIYRFLTYFPRWSSAYNNFYSNTSKFISPQLERVSFIIDDLDQIISNNKTINESILFGHRREEIKLLTIEIPKYIKTEYGYCVNMGEHSTASIDSVPIGAIKKTISHNIDKVSYNIFAGAQDIRLTRPSTVYLQIKKKRSSDDERFIVINGVSRYGKFITEKVPVETSVPIETINEYAVINRITGVDDEIILSNYIENDISHSESTSLDKRIASKDGIYFIPEFEIYDSTLIIKNADSFSSLEEFKYNLPFIPDTVLISSLLDVLMLKDNKLYSSKLMLDYYSLFPPGSSVNNNSFIYVDDENAEVGKSVNITINTDLLKSESLATNIKISVLNNNQELYLDSSSTLVPSSDTWIKLANTGNRIVLSINIDNDLPYIFELRENTRQLPYHAMSYQNKIVPISIGDNIDNIYFHNKNLYIQNLDSTTYTVDPVRLGFTTDSRFSYLQYEFEEMELIYES
ncbi:MAG: hypothetical protein DRQ60_05075 [Gammaproteobacteria bacterium]|nr:MAG: hypothetical protein DRQ60_05075 [Gammaproteobacteria bacterium]